MHLSTTVRLTLSLAIATSTSSFMSKTCSAAMSTMMKAVQYKSGATPEDMSVGEVPVPMLREGEMLIKVHSSAINRADTIQRKGLYPPLKGESEILGLEAAGEITQLNELCVKKWNLGDRVMALLPGGGNAEYVAVDSRHAMAVPRSITMLEAGGIPEVWLTAYQLLHFVGGLQTNDKVLIHAGASGVGTAAIQLVKLAGAIPYVTAGSADKISYAKSLGAADGFNYKEGEWASKVLNATDGKGVDMVLDCVGGNYWQQNTDALSVDGRWILYGLMGGANIDGPLLGKLLRKRISILPSTLKSRDKQYKATLVDSFETNILPSFDLMKLKPIVETSFDLKDIGKAHSLMEANSTIGKILVKMITENKEEL